MRIDGDLFTHKVLSTPQNPANAVIQGVDEILRLHNNTDAEQLEIVHGSTVATNALLERRGARIALVTTKGFEDILEIGRQARPSLYDFFVERPAPLVPADRRFGVSERTLHTGEIQTEIETHDLDTTRVQTLRHWTWMPSRSVSSLLMSTHKMNRSLRNTSHNLGYRFRVHTKSYLSTENMRVSVPLLRMRTSVPTLERHLSTLMESEQFPKSFRLMLSNGGSVSARAFQRSLQAENLLYRGESAGIRTVLSGPAGGVLGAYQIAKTAGYDQIITFDMGGTSTDVSLCHDGISLTTESTISGLPIKVPLIDIHTVGAGGGSIATVDTGGALRVGPESAGAAPGPICYGNNGEDITVTDANLYLGRIAATQFLGGAMSLDTDKATRAYIEKFAARLGIPPLQAADGILKVANAAMERAIKVISVERGFDTRDFTLVSFGGAGGLHAAFMAENLGIGTILIPPNGGLLSAYGMLFADVIKDYSQTVLWQFETDGEGTC